MWYYYSCAIRNVAMGCIRAQDKADTRIQNFGCEDALLDRDSERPF